MARKLRPDEALVFDEAMERAGLAAEDAISFLRHLMDDRDESAELAWQAEFWPKGSRHGPLDS